jgi:hypothetical protein
MLENRVLRKIFEPLLSRLERRSLQNEELHGLCSSPNIIRVMKSRRMRWAGHAARMGERRGACKVLVDKPDRKKPHGRPRCRWEDNIKTDKDAREHGLD